MLFPFSLHEMKFNGDLLEAGLEDCAGLVKSGQSGEQLEQQVIRRVTVAQVGEDVGAPGEGLDPVARGVGSVLPPLFCYRPFESGRDPVVEEVESAGEVDE